jgi:hypothetical protein
MSFDVTNYIYIGFRYINLYKFVGLTFQIFSILIGFSKKSLSNSFRRKFEYIMF